jgi:hypothetical protein
LRAKLQRREGKLDQAAGSMAQAWQSIQAGSYAASGNEPSDEEHSYIFSGEGPAWSFDESASGDLAALHLAHGEFVQSLDIFLAGGLWNDASFVAERVLTADELKTYVDAHSAGPNESNADRVDKLRYLFGRRLVREDRYDEAARYLPQPYKEILQIYVKALKDGADDKLPKPDRARAWFKAAWLARHDGMELMGTEVAPDVFATEGAFEITDVASERQSGRYQMSRFENGEEKIMTAPLTLKPSKQELQRLAKNKINPDVRYHYRLIAGALAMKAAQLLPDNSEELADVINTAGLWVKDRDEKVGDRYYQILEKRAAKTNIGRAAIARHWFVDEPGPWSQRQQEEHAKMHDELRPER